MIETMLDHFARQLPDIDPAETKEWIEDRMAEQEAEGSLTDDPLFTYD